MRLPLALFCFFFLFVPAAYGDEDDDDNGGHVALLDPRYLEDEVLNGVAADGADWLVVFYPDPSKSYTVYTALRIEQLSKTVRENPEWINSLRIGVVQCRPHLNTSPLHLLFPSPICRPNDETSSEAFVISGVGFGNTSKVTAVEEAFSNERSWTPKRLLRRIATVLGTKLRSRIKSSSTSILANVIDSDDEGNGNDEEFEDSDVIATVNFERRQIKVNRSKGDSELGGADSVLRYSKDDLRLMEYNPCSWNDNWLLNVVASEDCRSEGSEDKCDVSKDLYRTLNSMSRRKDTFSVMGFVSKFFKVCERLDKRRVILKKRSSTQAPKRVSSEVADESVDSAHHSYSVRNTNPSDLSRTLIDYGTGDDAEMLPAKTTAVPESTTMKYIATSTMSSPTTPSPISLPSHTASSTSSSSSSSSSYVDRYLNQMDQLRNPAMVRYRLGIMFNDLKAADKERPRSTSVSNPDTSNSVLVERMCRRTDRSKAFVTNHIRDVVYISDLEQAMRISLSMLGRQYDYYRSRRERREGAEKERRALRNYINLLHDFFPTSQMSRLKEYLKKMSEYVNARRDDFSIEGFVAESEKLESQLRPYTNDSFDYKFIGCNSDAADGAVAGGYPCALWQLFHVLSVEHAHRWKWRRLRREFDVVGIITDFVTEFYRATSKSLFLRLLSLDPPRARADPEEAMLWLWKAHNRLNLLLYDHEVERQASVRSRRDNSRMGDGVVMSRNLCKNRLFPTEEVCEVCYDRRSSGEFGSRRRIARYLYAVYTAEKVL